MNDFLIDRCGQATTHPPHKYGTSVRDERGQLTIVHPLYCDGGDHE